MHGRELQRDAPRSFGALPVVVRDVGEVVYVVVDSREVWVVSDLDHVTRIDGISNFENQLGCKWPIAGKESLLIVGDRLTVAAGGQSSRGRDTASRVVSLLGGGEGGPRSTCLPCINPVPRQLDRDIPTKQPSFGEVDVHVGRCGR